MNRETELLEKLERLDNLRKDRPEYSDMYMNRLKEHLVREYMVFERKKGGGYHDILSSFKNKQEYREWYETRVRTTLKRRTVDGSMNMAAIQSG